MSTEREVFLGLCLFGVRILFADPFYWREMELDDWVKEFYFVLFCLKYYSLI